MKVFRYVEFGEWGQDDIDHNKELARQMLTQKKGRKLEYFGISLT